MKKMIIALLLVNMVLVVGDLLYDLTAKADRHKGPATQNGDVNGDESINLGDAIYLLTYLFQNGPEPVALADSPEVEARLAALEEAVAALQANSPGAEEVAEALFNAHGDDLTGPAGPMGPEGPPGAPGAGDPVAQAYEQLKALMHPGESGIDLPAGTLQKMTCDESGLAFYLGELALGEVIGFSGRDAISSLFEYTIAIRTEGADLTPDKHIGGLGQLHVTRDGITTVIAGRIAEFALASYDGRHAVYVARLTPDLDKLSRFVGNRVFQEKTVPQMAAALCNEHAIPFNPSGLTVEYPIKTFEMQYGESQLAFMARLMEEEGIFFFFKHANGGSTLHAADTNAAFIAPGGQSLPYRGHNASPAREGEATIRTFKMTNAAIPRTITLDDYDFEAPDKDLAVAVSGDDGEGELYDFGLMSTNRSDLQRLANVRFQRAAMQKALASGTSTASRLSAGQRFNLSDETRASFTGDYVVIALEQAAVVVTEDGKPCLYYGNRFKAIPSSVPYRPARKTPIPELSGPQPAQVVGPAGETLWTDAHGRVKVQFLWDREGMSDEHSSAWVRVSRLWAGDRGKGTMWLPEVGDEVLVSFEAGAPRRPIVLGSLFNGDRMPPSHLPDNKHRTILATRRHTLVFDDQNETAAISLNTESGHGFFMGDEGDNSSVSLHSREGHGIAFRKEGGHSDVLLYSSHGQSLAFGADDTQPTVTLRSDSGDITLESALDLDFSSGDQCDISAGSMATMQAPLLDFSATKATMNGTFAFTTNAGSTRRVSVGERYRDNTIIAWGTVDPLGRIADDFGIRSVRRTAKGVYSVVLESSAAEISGLVPMILPLAVPDSPETVRVASFLTESRNTFTVYINSLSGLVDNAFVIMVTGR